MIVEAFAQRSAAWHRARLGIPTASHFDEILTPKTLKPSASATAYLNRLLSEWITGVPSDSEASGFMERGTALEAQAVSQYGFMHDVEVQKVGIILADDRMVGASPDGLVGEEGMIEVKCPSAHVHVANLLNGMGGYIGQTQGALWLSGRKWLDLVSFNPAMPPAIVRIQRDEAYAEAMEREMASFLARLKAARVRLLELGCEPAERMLVTAEMVTEDPW